MNKCSMKACTIESTNCDRIDLEMRHHEPLHFLKSIKQTRQPFIYEAFACLSDFLKTQKNKNEKLKHSFAKKE